MRDMLRSTVRFFLIATSALVAGALSVPVLAQRPASAPVSKMQLGPQDSVGRVSVSVQPETVTVGQPFTLRLRAIPPVGRTPQPPAVPDTGGIVEPLDPAVVTRRGDTLFVRYRLIAWQPGVLTIPIGPVLMRRDASELSVPFDARVVVRSVLPSDSADRVAKPPRALVAQPARWWEKWWQWALGLLLLLALIFIADRWRQRTPRVKTDAQSPLERAESAFMRLDVRALPSLGEGARHVALAAEILRQYLADIAPSLALSLTSSELLTRLHELPVIPERQVSQFLRRVDAVRFGGAAPSRAVVQSVSGQARELVREIDRLRESGSERAA
jgi:hypothetical protein